MNIFYIDQSVKPSATSTFNQTDFSKTLATTYSAKLVSKTRSFRAKLKSKIAKPRTKSITTTKSQAYWTSSYAHNKADSIITDKNTVVNAICKLMNKSRGLFRSNTKKPKNNHECYTDRPEFLSFINYNNETQCSISIDENLNDCSYSINANTCCVSTPKKARLSTRYSPQEDNLEQDISAMSFHSPTVHSTPNYFFNNLQVSSNNNNVECSYLSSSIPTTSSSSVSLISGNRLKSFGMTSSPMSTNSLKNSIGTESSGSFNESYLPRYDEVEALNQEKLIRHLNNIKRNVRLSVELRNVGVVTSEVANKRRLYEIKGENVTNSTKKKRLQKMFRLKIQRQLKEIKTWRIGFRNKLEVSHVNGVQYDCVYGKYPEYNYGGNHYYMS